ncbi:hypothetical protein COO60DRAFT_1643841 [Scenedesmus sp. NREL 46B-D3]|nr:hypothetical protein COO60DRAFT_1643841 [Scenedesmus sp. NREL 46B-D3]
MAVTAMAASADAPAFTFGAVSPTAAATPTPPRAATARLRQSCATLEAELWNARFALQQRQDEAARLKQTLRSLRDENGRLRAMFDECQDELFDHVELKAAHDTARQQLQEANVLLRRSAAQRELAHARARKSHGSMLSMSEQSARCVLMWVDHVRGLEAGREVLVRELDEARDAAAICCTCHSAKATVVLLPCGHCACDTCKAHVIGKCPVCRCVPASLQPLYL